MRKHCSNVCKLRPCLTTESTILARIGTIVSAVLEQQYSQMELIFWITLVHFLSFYENCADYDVRGTVEVDRPQMTVWCIHVACWIPKATNTHTEYVILFALPLQQWLHEHASLSHYMSCFI